MFPALATRILRTTDKRCLWKFAWNFGVKGTLSVEKFKRRIKRGEYFPPFLYLSIINSCNLRCQGCWVDVEEKDAIDLDTLNRTVTDAKRHGNAFFGILGGEPFDWIVSRAVLEERLDQRMRNRGLLGDRRFCRPGAARRLLDHIRYVGGLLRIGGL